MNNTRIYGLDLLRVLAITLVFLYHYQLPYFGHPSWLQDVAKFGWTGVDLFFVLSGLLIASPLFKQAAEASAISFNSFFVKRFLRIIPPFLLTVILYETFPGFHEKEALPPLWKFLSFTQNFFLDISQYGTFSHAWSLCVEEHFYLFFPLLLILLLKFRSLKYGIWILGALFVLGFLLRWISWNNYLLNINREHSWSYWYEYVYYPTYNRLDDLLVGVGIAALRQFSPVLWSKVCARYTWFLLCGMVLLASAYLACRDERSYAASIIGFPLVALGYGCIVVVALSRTKTSSVNFQTNAVAALAILSYPLYLIHKGVIHVSQNLLASWSLDVNSTLVMIICFAICVLMSAAIHFAVEKPSRKLRSLIIKPILHESKTLS